MNEQEVFDTVTRHLLTQMKQARDSVTGICRYRLSDGLKCAVGCLFSDTEHGDAMEGKGIDQLIDEGLMPGRLRPHVKLLRSLQHVHDKWSPDDWLQALRLAADKHGLSDRVAVEFEA